MNRHIFFHAIPIITIVAIIVIAFSGVDSNNDLPGLFRMIIFGLGVGLWSLLFSITMLVYIVRNKFWLFLALATFLLLARIIYFSEIAWGNSEDHMYLWLPVEYILFYWVKYNDTKIEKLRFTIITAALYALCYIAYTR